MVSLLEYFSSYTLTFDPALSVGGKIGDKGINIASGRAKDECD